MGWKTLHPRRKTEVVLILSVSVRRNISHWSPSQGCVLHLRKIRYQSPFYKNVFHKVTGKVKSKCGRHDPPTERLLRSAEYGVKGAGKVTEKISLVPRPICHGKMSPKEQEPLPQGVGWGWFPNGSPPGPPRRVGYGWAARGQRPGWEWFLQSEPGK